MSNKVKVSGSLGRLVWRVIRLRLIQLAAAGKKRGACSLRETLPCCQNLDDGSLSAAAIRLQFAADGERHAACHSLPRFQLLLLARLVESSHQQRLILFDR